MDGCSIDNGWERADAQLQWPFKTQFHLPTNLSPYP